jgi:hypothetical protein
MHETSYIDRASAPPVRLHQLYVRASDIRNVKSEAGVYPSDLQAEGVIADSGTFKPARRLGAAQPAPRQDCLRL